MNENNQAYPRCEVVILSEIRRGSGDSEADPVRVVRQIHTTHGDFIAEGEDPYKQRVPAPPLAQVYAEPVCREACEKARKMLAFLNNGIPGKEYGTDIGAAVNDLCEALSNITIDASPTSLKHACDTARQACKEALVTLAGLGIPTPQETYGTNIGWAMHDVCVALVAKRLLWRMPKRGDKVRCVAKHPDEKINLEIGKEYFIDAPGTWQEANKNAEEKSWQELCDYAIWINIPVAKVGVYPLNVTAPLSCFEPVFDE